MADSMPRLEFANKGGERVLREIRTAYDLLDGLRLRTGMYIGDNSILALRSFLAGFDLGLFSLDARLEEGDPPFGDFHDWVAARYGFRESTAGWANMLVHVTGGEDAALTRFFEDLDEFRQDRPRVIRSADAPPGTVARWSIDGVHHEAQVEGFELQSYGRVPLVYLVEVRQSARYRGAPFRSIEEAVSAAERYHRVPPKAWRDATTEERAQS